MKFLVAGFFCMTLLFAQNNESILIRYKVDSQDTKVREKMVAHLVKYLEVPETQKIAWLQNLASLATYKSNDDGTVTAEISYKVLFENFHILYEESLALQNKIVQGLEEKEALEKKSNTQQQTLEKLQQNNAALQKEVEEYKDSRSANLQKITKKEQELAAKNIELKALADQIATLQQSVKEKEQKLASTNQKCKELEAKNAASAKSLQEKEEELVANKTQLSSMKDKLAASVVSVETKKQQLESCNEKVQELEGKLAAAAKNNQQAISMDLLKTKELQLIKAQRQIESLQEKLESWQGRYQKQQKALHEFAEKIAQTKERLANMQQLAKKSDEMRRQLSVVVSSHKKLEEQLTALQAKIQDSKHKHQQEIEFLREQNDKMLQFLFNANAEFKKLVAQNKVLQVNNAKHQQQLATNRQQLNTVATQNKKLQKHSQELRQKYMDLYKKYWETQKAPQSTLQSIVDRQDLLLKELEKLKDEIYFLFDEE